MDRLPRFFTLAVLIVAGVESLPLPNLFATGSPPSKNSSEEQREAAARVNGEPIFRDDILLAIRLTPAPRGTPEAAKRTNELFDTAREQFIDRELLYQDAVSKLQRINPKTLKNLKKIQQEECDKHLHELETKNHMTHEQFLAMLRHRGMPLEHLQRVEQRKFLADEYLRSRLFPFIERETTEPHLLSYYQRHISEFRRSDGFPGTMFFSEARDIVSHKLRDEIAHRETRRIIQELRSRATIEIVNDSPSTPNPSAD
jgi:hypothetical protein